MSSTGGKFRIFPFTRNFVLTEATKNFTICIQAKGNYIMIQSGRDYSEEITNLCKQYNVKYFGLRGSSFDQENIGIEESEICFLVEFFPMEIKEYARCLFGLEKELEELFSREVILCDLTGITLPEMLQLLTKRKTDIYKAEGTS